MIVQRILEPLCADLRSLGSALLSALEKRDAEALSLLRATQETSLLNAMQQIKQHAIQEAESTVAGLEASLQTATIRKAYYDGLHQAWSTQDRNSAPTMQEAAQQGELNDVSMYQQQVSDPLESAAGWVQLVWMDGGPDLDGLFPMLSDGVRPRGSRRGGIPF
jgi:hypothetical protein